ncbi:hypothetical protein OGA_03045 [Enterococcus faecium EnGen0012]|uniref:helix-turn-helix domain-containing protein n=1 Tax=Enterococcus faecium TaxID=1352 RepID=UPI0002A2E631|nr:helix-turn-helix domain-containing protein [Enterococcus faecium]ELA53524.1 hypothetical protein OGA_03045 [Enterococcus faecium EnGen0012]EOH45625.1 hypothetical protein SSI_01665 [Enterococcus faecium EnGen0191]HAQ3640924.1 helix-turn-helix domain-containing protein [Enterococcus faecium]HAZ4706323.1 helix-turn-helix domain-containing protein [Enterococcus faecium]HCU0013957.1 helix-turn-helix domain-containing protein [Enterococcus faecium]
MVTIGKEIKRRRIELGFTKERMAAVLDSSLTSVDLWEKGTIVKSDRAQEISWFLHCKVSEIAYERA